MTKKKEEDPFRAWSGEGGRKRDWCSIDKHGARGEREYAAFRLTITICKHI